MVCGASAPDSASERSKSAGPYFSMLVVGFFVCLIEEQHLGLLDAGRLIIATGMLLLAPIIAGVVAAARNRPDSNSGVTVILQKWAAIAMVALALLLLANRMLDRSPGRQFDGIVEWKFASHTRGGSLYSRGISPSWRQANGIETVHLSYTEYAGVKSGDAVGVTIRAGAFGLPWCSDVEPR